MSNKFKNIIMTGIMVILFAMCIYYVCGYFSTTHELHDAQQNLMIVQDNFNNETAKSDALSAELADVKSELNIANEAIKSREGETYFIDCEVTEYEIDLIAKTVVGETNNCDKFQQSAVVWCILNRVDSGYGTIAEVVLAENQFHGYNPYHSVDEDIRMLVIDVVARWKLEKMGCWNVGRTLPKEYLFFHADKSGFKNNFTTQDPLLGLEYKTWDQNCWNPYE